MRRFTRRVWNRILLGLPLSAAAWWSHAATRPARAESSDIDLENLQEQLEFGLRAGRPYEHKFIRRIVALVRQKVLPVQLVLSTYEWARDKQPHPFPYFAQALRIRAARIGVYL